MKNSLKLSALLIATVALTACVQDLDTQPIDTNSSTSFNQDRMFTKCYATLGTTGQEGPAGMGDIEDVDEGNSAFYRAIWYLNVLTSDEGWWIWNDEKEGVPALRINDWNGDHPMVFGLYARLSMDIKYFNHFIRYADASTAEGQAEVTEVRFLRALNFMYMLDTYLYSPFSIEETTDYPHFYSRPQLYSWLEKELIELSTALPPKRVSKYRVDQAAAWLLLARLYINGPVYNPTWDDAAKKMAWNKAEQAADKALSYGYDLYRTPTDYPNGTHYSAFQKLFMADNDKNGSCDQEAVLLIYQDGMYCRCYGGAQFLTAATRKTGMRAWGASLNWGCYRTSPTAVYKFTRPCGFTDAQAANIKRDEYNMPKYLEDDRAILCSKCDTDFVWKLTGDTTKGKEACFFDCWSFCKFTNVYSTVNLPESSVGTDKDWPDLDIPFLRIAEAYLIKAEAQYRLGREQEALTTINNSVRSRANASPLQLTNKEEIEEAILDEWSREFMGEGRRRMDLVRFGRYFGVESDKYKYNWEGRLGQKHSEPFKSGSSEVLNWFPVPSKDKRINPNYATDVLSTSALVGGDGYSY